MAERELVRELVREEPATLVKTAEPEPSSSNIGPSVQGALESVAPLAGGLAGGTVGLASPVPGGAVIGAALGAAGGKALTEFTKSFLTEEGANPILEQYKNIIQEGLLFGISEGATSFVMKGVAAAGRFLTRPFRPSGGVVAPEIQRTREIMQQFGHQLKSLGRGEAPADLSIGQISGGEGGIADTLENIAASSFIGIRRADRFFLSEEKAITNFADDVIKQLGVDKLSKEQAGALYTEIVDGALQAQIPLRRGMYNVVRDLAGDKLVKTKEIVKMFTQRSNRDSVKEITGKVFDTGLDDLATFEMSAAGTQTFKVEAIPIDKAITIRSRLNEIVRDKGLSDPVGREANDLLRHMKEAIETSMPKKVNNALKAADDFVRSGEEMFNNKVTRRLLATLREEPAQLSNTLLRPNRPHAIERAKLSLATSGDPEGEAAFNKILRSPLTEGLINSAKDAATGIISGKVLAQKLQNLGSETTLAAFGSDGTKALTDLANAAAHAETRSTGPGRIFIQLAQAGAAAEIVAQPFSRIAATVTGGEIRETRPAAAVILIGPALLSRIMFNPNNVRLLTDGLEATTQKALARSVAQLSALGASNAIERQQLRAEKEAERELLR